MNDTERINILHVDDESDFAELVAEFLEREDDRFTLETATSAGEALDHVADEEFDCIVSDHEMPGQNGIEFLKTIREEYPDLPFILYTGKGSEEVASDAISAGVTDYLQKERGTDQYRVLANRIINAVESYRSQQKLAERNRDLRRYKHMINSMYESACIYDEDGRFLIVNDFLANWYNTTPEALEGEKSNLIPLIREQREDGDPYQALVDGQRDQVSGEIEAEFPGHGHAVLEYQLTPLTVAGSVEGVVGVTRDITKRKQRERELRQSERRFEALFNDPNILVKLTDTDGAVIDVNETAIGYIDAELEEVTGKLFWQTPWFTGDEAIQQEIREAVDQATTGEYVEFEVDLSETVDESLIVSGVIRPVENDDGEVVSLLISSRDITERKHRKRELKRYEAYLEESSDAITVVDDDGTIKYQSPAAEQILGYEQGEFLGENAFKYVHPDDKDEVYEKFTKLADETKETVTAEARFKAADDEWRWLEVRGSNRRNHDAIDGIVTVNRDITERKQVQQDLEQTNTVLSSLFETLPVGVLAEDADRNVLAVNERLFDLFEFPGTPDEITGADCEQLAREVSDLFVEPEQFVNRINELVTSGESVRGEELMLQDGRTFARDYELLELPEGLGHLWVYRDITDLKKREESLQRERDRLDEFAGVVSHDLRNPLNVAQGRLELAQEECDSEHLEAIETALHRIHRITEDVLWLSREGQDIGSMDEVVVQHAIEGAWSIVADSTEQAELHYGDDALSKAKIEADDDRLRQLLENLLSNAINHGGKDVTVTVGKVDSGLYIEDDGPGIPEDEREEVFSAGYSTDEEGTGFGLYIVKQIAEAHDWEIQLVESSRGGARFEITGVTFTAE